jgi:hypothetical protein
MVEIGAIRNAKKVIFTAKEKIQTVKKFMTGDIYENESKPKQRTGNEKAAAENDITIEDAILHPIDTSRLLYPHV